MINESFAHAGARAVVTANGGQCPPSGGPKPRVAIAGAGLITPLGISVTETWDSLLAGRFITDHSKAAGEYDSHSPRVIQMAHRAAGQALTEAGWPCSSVADSSTRVPLDDIALIVGTSKGSVCSWMDRSQGQEPATANANPQTIDPRLLTLSRQSVNDLDIATTSKHPLQHMVDSTYKVGGPNRPIFDPAMLGDIAARLAGAFGLGAHLTISAACASGLLALIRGAMMIESGQAQRVLVVVAEASVHPLFLASFARLGVLPKQGVGCRPFDHHRDGFLMSEAAAAICLEARPSPTAPTIPNGAAARQPQAMPTESQPHHHPPVFIDGYAMGADASHLTASDPSGRVLRHLINKVLSGRPVDLIHAHGTGTLANDPIELAALEKALADNAPAANNLWPQSPSSSPCLYSHKGALGHSLGAAGLISIVLSHRAHLSGVIPGNVRTADPLPTTRMSISRAPIHRPIRRSIALAAGFGGATAVVGLSSD